MTKTKLSLATAFFAAAALLSVGLAQADFTVKDSSTFAYGYEANSALPTAEDTATGWTKIGTTGTYGVAGGALNYSTMPSAGGGQWFATTAGGGWGSTITPGTSYTVEFAAQITEGVAALPTGVPGLHTVFNNGSKGIWLNVAPDHTAVGDGAIETSMLQAAVNNDDFHAYRLAFDATTNLYHVWRDGLSIGSSLAAPITTTATNMSFGDASSSGSGAGSIDYFRWDATGAYAPTPPAPQPKTPMDSADFAYKYEADSGLPTVEDSGAGKTNWGFVNAVVTPDFSVDTNTGVLSYSSMPNAGGGEWFQSTTAVAGSAWAANIGEGNSFTAEFSARVTAEAGAVPGLHTVFDNGSERIYLSIATDHVAVGNGNTEAAVLADELNNYTDFHTYRIAFDASTDLFEVWRDGESLGEVGSQASTSVRGITFGDPTSQGAATAQIDFFRWDPSGAYTPVPEPGILTLLGLGALGLLLFRKK